MELQLQKRTELFVWPVYIRWNLLEFIPLLIELTLDNNISTLTDVKEADDHSTSVLSCLTQLYCVN